MLPCRDVKKLGNDPKWDTMNKTGTDGQWWLDCEYCLYCIVGIVADKRTMLLA
jgi:hypothetical protein